MGILTNMLNCSRCDNVLLIYTTLTISSTNIISNDISSSNSSGFCDKKIEYLQTLLYDPGLKMLLSLNFKIVMIRYTLAITTS